MIGTEPTAAARCNGSCPRMSFTRALHLLAIKVRTVEIFALEVAKWRAFCSVMIFHQLLGLFLMLGMPTCPELLFMLTSAPLRSSRSMIGSPAASLRLAAIMSEVQPDPS